MPIRGINQIENLWDRTGTTLEPHTDNDTLDMGAGNIVLTGQIGVGTDTPDAPVHVVGTTQATSTVQATRYSGTSIYSGTMTLQKARGTEAIPTAVQAGDILGRFQFDGYNGSTFVGSGILETVATETFTATNEGSKFNLRATPTGSVLSSVILTAHGDGFVGINNEDPTWGLDIVANGMVGRNVVTDDTNKFFRVTGGHYDNEEEPMAVIMSSASLTNNTVIIGGGSSIANSATRIQFYSTNNTTTLTGTKQGTWDISGLSIGTTSTATARLDIVQDGSDILGDDLILKLANDTSGRHFAYQFDEDGNNLMFSRYYGGASYDVMTFNRTNGNVGIGTIDPNKPLDVYVGDQDEIQVQRTNATSGDDNNMVGIRFRHRTDVEAKSGAIYAIEEWQRRDRNY